MATKRAALIIPSMPCSSSPAASPSATSWLAGPAKAPEPVRPTVGFTVSYGIVHGYVEAYGRSLDSLTGRFEVASEVGEPALVTSVVPNRPAGDARSVFSGLVHVNQLPPGTYVLR